MSIIYLLSRFERADIGAVVNVSFSCSVTASSVFFNLEDLGSPLFSVAFSGEIIRKKLETNRRYILQKSKKEGGSVMLVGGRNPRIASVVFVATSSVLGRIVCAR